MSIRAAVQVGPFYLGKPSCAERKALEKRIPRWISQLSTPIILIISTTLFADRRLFIMYFMHLEFQFPFHRHHKRISEPWKTQWTQRMEYWSHEGQSRYWWRRLQRASNAILSCQNIDLDWFFTNTPKSNLVIHWWWLQILLASGLCFHANWHGMTKTPPVETAM